MEKLNKKEKHKHLFTNILKGSIFAIVMLAPMFSVLTRCLYVVCNPNAKDSYSNNRITQITQITNDNSLQEGLQYYVKSKPYNDNYTYYYLYSYISIDLSDYPTAEKFRIEDARTNQHYIAFYDSNNTRLVSYKWGTNDNTNDIEEFYFTYLSKQGSSRPELTNATYVYYYYTSTQSLDNAFEYSIEQLKESSMYNWAENTAIYQGLYDMCTGMGTNEVIPLLLAYWALLTAIYIVFDIIIWCFTKITHFVSTD